MTPEATSNVSSAKASPPVVGFNHNVRYGPRDYHVQTEDSGLPYAHYITHLFVGGNIVSSVKSSYAERAAEADLAKTVRSLMEAQHKLMLKRLISGEFNDLAERLAATHYEPGVLATGEHSPGAVNTAPAAPAAADSLSSGASAPRVPITVPSRPALAPAARAQTPALQRQPVPAPVRPPAPPLQRPAAPAASAPVDPFQPRSPEEAPRAESSFASPTVRAPREPVPAAAPLAARAPPPFTPAPPGAWQPAPPGASTPPSPRLPGAPLPSTTRLPPQPGSRPAPPRLSPIAPQRPPPGPAFRAAPPAPRPSLFADLPVEIPHDDLPTLFAEELISEKSLDEVILAFLSADLEPPK